MSRTRFTFRPITRQATRMGKCPVCGKRVTRTKVFSQTVNPFNRDALGQVRSSSEVYEAVNAEALAWVPDFRHAVCKAAQS